MKILHILQSSHFSGAENVACQIIKSLNENYECAYASQIGSIGNKLKELNINYYPMKKFNIHNLNKIVDEYNPDIIHAHDFTASVIASHSKFNGKIISHIHNNPPFIKRWNLKSIIYYLTIRKYTKIIGVSDSIVEEAVFGEKIKPKFVKIYNYVDYKKIKYMSNQGIGSSDFRYEMAFIGRLVEQKDPFEFIEIVRGIKEKNKNIKAVIIGNGPLYKKCIEMIDEYKLEKNIELVGFIDNPYYVLKNSKIIIMPSKWEGFGLTAIESLILNKPVLNSGVGGLKEIFEKNKYFICKSRLDYHKKINEILETDINFDYSKIYADYIDKDNWIKKIIDQYS